MTTGKTIALIRQTFVSNVMSLLFNMLSRLIITFLPRSKCFLISWLQSPSAVILVTKKIACHCYHCFPIYLPWSDGIGCMILVFSMLSFKPIFSLSSFTFIKRCFSFSFLSAISWGCILSPCLFQLYGEYIMQNARLDEAQAGIKIAGRNINNLSYADEH